MTTRTKKQAKVFDYKSIKSFEDACKKQGLNPNDLPDVSHLPEDSQKSVIAHYKLIIIFKAINQGWEPDWSNWDQLKYFPWFRVLSSGFGFDDSDYGCTNTHALVGSRLCTDTSEKALYIAETFKNEYRDYLLYSE